MAIRLHAVDCPACEGGVVRINAVQDPATGTWNYDEAPCVPCAGHGQIPAAENYETSTLPSNPGHLQWRCLFCECHVNPLTHLPGTEDCHAAKVERRTSREDWAS